jgi:DNA-binding PadR family transcriptional regulator
MLSNTMALLLGLVRQKRQNAYELNKMLSRMHIRDWCAMAPSTVYATLKAAQKKGYLSGVVAKSGNMPDKTMFCLTEAGETILQRTLTHFIVSFDYDITPFNISMFLADSFPTEQLQDLLMQRSALLEKYHEGMQTQIEGMKAEKLSKRYIANVRQSLFIVEAQQRGCEELLQTFN